MDIMGEYYVSRPLYCFLVRLLTMPTKLSLNLKHISLQGARFSKIGQVKCLEDSR